MAGNLFTLKKIFMYSQNQDNRNQAGKSFYNN